MSLSQMKPSMIVSNIKHFKRLAGTWQIKRNKLGSNREENTAIILYIYICMYLNNSTEREREQGLGIHSAVQHSAFLVFIFFYLCSHAWVEKGRKVCYTLPFYLSELALPSPHTLSPPSSSRFKYPSSR
jgi:hypothetical protein